MIGDKMKEEERKYSEINSEMNRLREEKRVSIESGNIELMFPLTTNQEYINQE